MGGGAGTDQRPDLLFSHSDKVQQRNIRRTGKLTAAALDKMLNL